MAAVPEAQSPVDIFAKSLDSGSKPGDAIHSALEGIDASKLTTFMTNLQNGIAAAIQGGPRPPGTIITDALKTTNADANFARRIQAAIRAADPSIEKNVSSIEMPLNTREQVESGLHRVVSSVDDAIDGYVNSLGTQGQPAKPDGTRRHFDKTQLTEAQHIAAGTATVAEIKDVQKELKAEGLKIGRFGKKHDGVDGKAGEFTRMAMAQAMKKVAPSSAP